MSKFSVFATKDLALPNPNLAFASCECASCGTQFTVQASLDEPFCVQCGSDDTKVESNTTVTASVHKLVPEQDPSYVTCATCETHLVISSAIEQSGVLFCPCCGNSAVHASDEGVTFGPEHEGRTEVHMHSGENIDPQEPLDKCAKPEDRVSNPAAAKRDHENQEVANWDHLEDIDDDDDYDLDDMDDDDDMDLVDTIGEDDDAHWCDDDYPDASNQLAASEEDDEDEVESMLQNLDKTLASLEELAGDCEFKVGDSQAVIDALEKKDGRDSNPAAAPAEEHHHEVPVEAKKHEDETPKGKHEKSEKDDKHKDKHHMKKEESNVTNPPGADGRLPEFQFPSDQEVFNNSVAKEKLSQTHTNPDGTDNSVNRDSYPAAHHPAISLLDIVRVSEPGNPPIRFGRVEASILAYVGPYTVAKLDKEEVNAKYQPHFDRQEYLQAIANSVSLAGFDQTLKDYGFKLLTLKPNSEQLASLVQERVETAAVKMVEQREQANLDEIKNCMAVAMAGFTKNFWEESNPIRNELASTLEGAGLRSAVNVVDKAIASAGDSYAEQVLAKTWEILGMHPDARTQVAKTIMGSKHQAAKVETASVGYADIKESLSNPMVGVTQETASVRPSGRSNSPVQRTVAQFRQSGQRLFNN